MRRVSDGVLLLLVGAALGPAGLGVLSDATLSFLDPVMPVALVALGVLAGFSFRANRPRDMRLLTAATLEGALTTAAVGAAMLVIVPAWQPASTLPLWFIALVLGICAASSAESRRSTEDPPSVVERIGALDGLFPIALGGLALALLREPTPNDALLLVLQACGVALVMVLAAWLVIGTSTSETEQRVFTAALLLLLAGAADYLSLSALLSGLIAGLFLEAVGGPARDAVRRDVLHFQHPLVVLVLLVTGAQLHVSLAWIGLAASYLVLRLAAKLVGAQAARRVAGPAAPGDLGMALVAPGILGIAFALNVARASGADATAVLATAAFGAIGSDVIAALIRR